VLQFCNHAGGNNVAVTWQEYGLKKWHPWWTTVLKFWYPWSDFLHLSILDPSVMMILWWWGGVAPLSLHLCEGQLVSICLVHASLVPIPLSITILP
jgi:hypothetical protein